MDPIAVQLVLTFHQPLSVGDAAIDIAARELYEPLLTRLKAVPAVRISLHINGHLLDHLSKRHEDLLHLIKDMIRAQQIEVLGGPFYGVVPALVSETDIRGQIEMMNEYWESLTGEAPTGIWLSDLAWSVELPRLLDETGLAYGFVSPIQIAGDAATLPSLGVVERGSQRVAAFVLDDEASARVATENVTDWLADWVSRARERDAALTTAWQRAELIGKVDNGMERWTALLNAMTGGEGDMAVALPKATYPSARPAAAIELLDRVAMDLPPYGSGTRAAAWTELAREHLDIDTLTRRLQRASDKLREAITTMEEEGIEETWSDTLATAQRLVFGAQSPEAYRPTAHIDERRAHVESALQRIVRAESLVEELVQGSDDWIATEEEDRDGDLVDEIFVSNGRLSLWLTPTDDGSVRTLDDRSSHSNVLDLGHEAALGTFCLDAQCTAEQYFAGSGDLIVASEEGEVLENRIDEEGDASFHFKQRSVHYLDEAGTDQLAIERNLQVPIDAAELCFSFRAQGPAQRGLLCGLLVPVRLLRAPARVLVAGEELQLNGPKEVSADNVRFVMDDGSGVELALPAAGRIWILPGGPNGSRAARLAVVTTVEGTAEWAATVRLVGPKEPQTVAQAA